MHQPFDPALGQVAARLPVHDARALTGDSGLAQIVLDGQVYTLRITRAGRLILTK
jgi:hemin uptake protein HemP